MQLGGSFGIAMQDSQGGGGVYLSGSCAVVHAEGPMQSIPDMQNKTRPRTHAPIHTHTHTTQALGTEEENVITHEIKCIIFDNILKTSSKKIKICTFLLICFSILQWKASVSDCSKHAR